MPFDPIADKLHGDILKLLADPDMKRRIVDLAIDQGADSGPEKAGAMMKAYADQMGRLIQAAGIKPE